MSDAPRQPPPKKEVALALLEESSMFIHLDPRRADVLVPKGFTGQPQLVLQVGLNMAIAIPDLKIDDDSISCTLSFNRSPFWCRIPWTAVYALVGEDGRGGVWADDVPPEIQQQKQASPTTKAPASKKPRPKLAAVSSRSSKSADVSEASDASEADAEPQRGPSADGSNAMKMDDDAFGVPRRPARSPLTSVPREAPPAEATDQVDAGRPAPASPNAKKPKREIPPYLRVIK